MAEASTIGEESGQDCCQQIMEGGEGSCEEMAFLLCAVAPDCHRGVQVTTRGDSVDGAQGAVVTKDKLWTDKDVLNVYFLPKPDVAAKVAATWELTTAKIIEWANTWNTHEVIPEFQETTRKDRADIRVELSDKKGCWSKVGTKAKDVEESKPTMVLNLGKKSGCKAEKCKRSLVIHEFGHALGLEHEHQRSDFWKTVKNHMDLDRMRNDRRVTTKGSGADEASYGKDWFEKEFSPAEDGVDMTDYDPKSIMHYGFDKDWIKEKRYHDYRTLMSAPKEDLKNKEKQYLMGIHERHGSLADGPSEKDIEALQSNYGARAR